jgi:6-pyruvoyltetrahydropterin/6-carboxytetrahydropterin synthase
LEFFVSPYARFFVSSGVGDMVGLTRSFEFSAAHRLGCPDLSDEENRRLFGKCSHPGGHGHNYVLEVTVRGTPSRETGLIVALSRLDAIVKARVVDAFDHKNLNVDCAEFAELNPTVENIARVIWRRLHGALDPVELAVVRVWETPKTCAEYSGEE